MAEFKPSKYQKAVYTYIQRGRGNAVVNAVAGSGKSTTIVNALRIIPQDRRVLFLAFNKSIVEELKRKVGDLPNVEISTLHSLGARALMRSLNARIDADKYRRYLMKRMEDGTIGGEHLEHLPIGRRIVWRNNVLTLLDLARVNLTGENVAEVETLAEKHGLDLLGGEPAVVVRLMSWGRRETGRIDFTDMIYFPNIMDIVLPTFDWVFIDECQDLNAAQRGLFLRCVARDGGRWIAVGDERQAIYGFSGADADSFARLKSLPRTATLPLSICYRCDRSIVDLARSIVPQIESRPQADEGEVSRESLLRDVKDGDMILCRVTAPLVRLCMRYIAHGTKAYVKGRDIGRGLVTLLERTGETEVSEALVKLQGDLERLVEKLMRRGDVSSRTEAEEHPQYVTLKDRVDSIDHIAEECTSVSETICRITEIFADDGREGICLSTIHKAKGLENDRVFVICEDKLPLKGCMKVAWQAEQEYNLMYVCYTRAKHFLGFIQDFSA